MGSRTFVRVLVAAVLYTTAAYAPTGCNPLADPSSKTCLLPWPSDHFLTTTWDATAPPSLGFLTNAT